jgi:hypothetical protein
VGYRTVRKDKPFAGTELLSGGKVEFWEKMEKDAIYTIPGSGK